MTAVRSIGPGARLALFAPSSPFDAAAFHDGVAFLRTRYEVTYDDAILARDGFLAGDDARRTKELLAHLTDRRIDALVAARGGYGATRLLGDLPLGLVRANAKPLVGFSDVTALHAVWAGAGVPSLHGAMVASLGRATEPLRARWVRSLEGAVPAPVTGLRSLTRGQARGRLVGGNLSVLAALAGTPFAPPLDGAVLFLEDVGERPYRVDRMLTTLRDAGWLTRIRGVLLGAFVDAATGADGTTVDAVLARCLGRLPVPVLSGVPAGHVDDNLELPLLRTVELDADAGTASFDDRG